MAVPEAVALVDLALKAVTAYDRPDLAPRLRQTKARLTDPVVRVLVVGEFKQGKSQLVNALVNATVCPVDDDIATAVPTLVRYGEEISVTLVREAPGPDGAATEQAERTVVGLDQLAEHVSEAGNPGNRARLTRAEVTLPRKLLQSGLALVDTPGVGGLGSAHGAATMSALPTADAVLLVSDASQEYTAPSWSSCRPRASSARTSPASSPRPTCTRTGAGSSTSTRATCAPPGSTPSCCRSPPRCGCTRPAPRTSTSSPSPASRRSPASCCARSSVPPTTWTAVPPARTCSSPARPSRPRCGPS
nr:dynamin family protein [Pseudonocardia sp. AL041005-10]